MTQSLLGERFGLEVHREKKGMLVYVLLMGKPPLRLKDSVIDKNAPPPPSFTSTGTGSAQGIAINLGNASSFSFAGGKFAATKVTAPRLSESSSASQTAQSWTDRVEGDLRLRVQRQP